MVVEAFLRAICVMTIYNKAFYHGFATFDTNTETI